MKLDSLSSKKKPKHVHHMLYHQSMGDLIGECSDESCEYGEMKFSFANMGSSFGE